MNHFRHISALCLSFLAITASGEQIEIPSVKYNGPFQITSPVMIDSVDVNSKKFDPSTLLLTPLSLSPAEGINRNGKIILSSDVNALHLLTFSIDNERYVTATIKVKGSDNHEVYLDGEKLDNDKLVLTPATHTISVKCLTLPTKSDTIDISLCSDRPELINVEDKHNRRFTLTDVMTGRRFSSAKLSPSGKYLLRTYYNTHKGGKNTFSYELSDFATGKTLGRFSEPRHWMPKSDLLYFTRMVNGKRQLVTMNPSDASEKIIAKDVPSAYFTVSPTEDFMIYVKDQKGPKEKNPDVYEIIHPEDRQEGWRDRGTLMKYDFMTGLSYPLTFGNRNVSFSGISDDGTKVLFRVTDYRLEKRPTSLSSLYFLDLKDNSMKTLIEKDGFIGSAFISPDGNKIAVIGSPEALGGIGRNLPTDRIPSMYDNQLFIFDVASGTTTPLTRDFNPSVEDDIKWNRYDGNIYFTALDRDRRSLYRVNPSTGKIDNLNALEEYVASFDISKETPALVYVGQGASNSDRLYSLDTKKLRHSVIEDLDAQRMDGIKIGKCMPYRFLSSRGDSICGRYILPPDFDPTRKYPVIVNYYGGCSPTSRTFEGRYPHHVYAAHGYVVLVINPSGSAGFGQEFASRHVNTAGEGVADDIIEGVKQFLAENPWADATKVGCIGASYGGFMTQYLQTRTDLFAAAISHAGISDHTSYWGEGYWGYSYSEVSMADSYPWSHTELFVNRSPLYNADKIHTPILFLHGDADMNVPFGESIQMYTALKLLGRETAFVAVKDTGHHVTDYDKRQRWQETIFAWFAKHLQDDPSWWESLYPTKPESYR